ncbi:MAG: LysM peptidoglycan-binding domain-containing protein [Deltaproteobacteria bacterium]|nr:LysM peptidoglycan-binding domain-containing protein [Deltaproteobacteria bacterium]
MRLPRAITGALGAVLFLGTTVAPDSVAQEVHEATLVVGAGADPYPVALQLQDGQRASIRGDARALPAPQAEGLSLLELERSRMDQQACRAFFGPDAVCGPPVVPPPRLFAGVRVPRVFTTAAVAAVPGEPSSPAAETVGTAEASPPAEGGGRDLSWLQGIVLPDLPVHWNEKVVYYLEQMREGGSFHGALEGWYRRSGRWSAMVREVFRRHGLPEDLLWVAAIESSFGPTERSSAGAVGLWQFMPAGGRIYGLRQNRWIDERRNPERSTEAVALYFADLHKRFHSWDLALAGYNMGWAGLEKAVVKHGTNDYWTLVETENALPFGTTIYVAKALAVAVATRNPDRFGLTDATLDPPEPYDVVEVRGVERVAALARAARITPEAFKRLNPELLRDRTPPGEERWSVRVPAGAEEGFVERLAAAREQDQARAYTVRFGETLPDVAYRFRTTTARLRQMNGLGDRDGVRGGEVLDVPDVEPRDLEPADPKPLVVVPAETFVYPGRERVFYRTLAGDTLEAIAEAFGVTATDLVTWNTVDPEAYLAPGLVLQLFVPPSLDRATVLVFGEGDVLVFTAGSAELFEHLARQEGRERIVYVVTEGDTLETIARRFATTAGSLSRVNHFGRNTALSAGDEVVVWSAPEEARTYLREAGRAAASGRPEHRPDLPIVEPESDEPPEDFTAPLGDGIDAAVPPPGPPTAAEAPAGEGAAETPVATADGQPTAPVVASNAP